MDGPADARVAQLRRRVPPLPLRRGNSRRPSRRCRPSSGARAPPLLDLLSLALERRPAVSRLPVGPAPSRGRFSRDLVRADPARAPRGGARGLAGNAGARLLAPLSPHVRLGIRQARERRPQLAKPLGADVPLLDAAAAPLDGLVRESRPDLVPKGLLFRDVRGGARRSVPHPRPAAVAIDRLRRDGGPPGDHRRDRQLRLLQSPDGRPLRPARGRRLVPGAASDARRCRSAGGGGTLAALGPGARGRGAPVDELRSLLRGDAPVACSVARLRDVARPRRDPVPLGRQLRPLHGDDDDAPGDRRRGERRRRHVAALRVPLEARGRDRAGRLSCRRTSRGSTGRCGSPLSAAAKTTPGSSRSSAAFSKARRRSSPSSRRIPSPTSLPATSEARLYDYRFTDSATRRKTGAWWQRQPLGPYCPAVER